MLVLSRKRDEKIIIGDKITIMVIEIRGDKVRLGIDAPTDVTVHREEVYHAIQREHRETEASKLGLKPGTPEWTQFIETGHTEIEVDLPPNAAKQQ